MTLRDTEIYHHQVYCEKCKHFIPDNICPELEFNRGRDRQPYVFIQKPASVKNANHDCKDYEGKDD